jgi:hypothetical protein
MASLIFVSMAHSSALQLKVIYPLFTLIVWHYRRLDRANGQ